MMKINYFIKLINSLDQLLLDHECQLVILKRGAIFYVKNELLKTLPNPHSHLVKYGIAIPTVFQPLKAWYNCVNKSRTKYCKY